MKLIKKLWHISKGQTCRKAGAQSHGSVGKGFLPFPMIARLPKHMSKGKGSKKEYFPLVERHLAVKPGAF